MFLPNLNTSRKIKLCRLRVDDILPNPHQPRKRIDEASLAVLSESIRKNGILVPLLVQKREDGCFQLISGERRLLAARKAAFAKVPCYVIIAEPVASALYPIIDSIHSAALNPFEEATAIRRMMDSFRFSKAIAAEMLGISESALSAKLSVLKLNDIQRSRALEGKLSLSAIRAVASLEPEKRDSALNKLLNPQEAAEPRRKISGAADLRFFDNSLNRLLDGLCASGLRASCSKRDNAGYSEYIIRINKSDSTERQLSLF